MDDILRSIIKPAELVFAESSGLPRQYRISDDTVLQRGLWEKQKKGSLRLHNALLDKTQGKFIHRLGEWHYQNLSDKNETFLNGKVLPCGEEAVLRNQDVLMLSGRQKLIIAFFEDYSEEVQWKLLPLGSDGELIHVFSHEGSFAVADTDDPEAKHHALLCCDGGSWYAEDVNTERVIFVNQEKVNGSRKLAPFDTLCIGDTVFFCQDRALVYNVSTFVKNELSIHIEERSAWNFLKKHVLLQNIDLKIEPGSLVLILGGSGAGKTTFVNAVTGYEKAKARIMEGKLNVYENYGRMKYEIGFVPQQDLLRGDDTVQMTLKNAAQLRMPEDSTDEKRDARVREVLEMVGLNEVKSELVSKLSGGQRKRLSIGVEFVSDPSLFILDEPDSGLDGVMAKELMERLRAVADQKKIVMVITHSPDRVISQFDHVIVLAKDQKHVGQLAFFGTIAEARSFFGKESMEDIVLAVNPKDAGGEGLADQYIEKYKEYKKQQNAS